MDLRLEKSVVRNRVKKWVCEGRSSRCAGMALTLGLLLSPLACAETVTTLDDIDIEFWVGSGANRAAVVIDWDDTSAVDEALVWGYRWDGTATGEDMLKAVLESDDRLFARFGLFDEGLGAAVFGLGYDLDDDETFGISDGTDFGSDGIAHTGIPDNPPDPAATATDPEDLYAEGWFSGFWHYGISSGNPFDGASGGDEWASSGGGASGRTLSDGDWDSWTFTPTFDFTAFAENPVAAESPFTADFDSDGDTDGADFLAWQRGVGIDENATLEQGDADGNMVVDEFDLQIWFSNFGFVGSSTTGGALQSTVFVVPEPSCIACAVWVFFLFLGRCPHRGGSRQTTRRRIS